MAGFIPAHRQQQILKAGVDFGRWWFAELAQLLPLKWRRALSGRRASCRVTVLNGELIVAPSNDQSSANQASSDARANAVLALGDDDLLLRELNLPLLSESDIANLLHYEIDRLCPFPKDNVCYDYEVLQSNQQSGQLRLRLVCLEKAALLRLLEQCQSLGLTVSRVERAEPSPTRPAGPFEPAARTLNLLPLERRPAKEKIWNSANKLTAALVAVLLISAVVLPIWHYQQQITALNYEVDTLLDKSKVVRLKQARLMTAFDIRDALVQRKNSEFEKLLVLDTLTRVIPDNTWLSRMTIRHGAVEIEGESDKSSDLIEKLESEAMFSQVGFASSVTRNALTGKERFQITMTVSDKPAVQAAELALIEAVMTKQAVVEVVQ